MNAELLPCWVWAQQNEGFSPWKYQQRRLCCNSDEYLATKDNSWNQNHEGDINQKRIFPCSSWKSALNSSDWKCKVYESLQRGSKAAISRCFSAFKKTSTYWKYEGGWWLFLPWCKPSKTLHCSVLVSAQEAPHCARSCASHSHQSQIVGTSWRKEPMAWHGLAFGASSNSKPSLTERITCII